MQPSILAVTYINGNSSEMEVNLDIASLRTKIKEAFEDPDGLLTVQVIGHKDPHVQFEYRTYTIKHPAVVCVAAVALYGNKVVIN